MTFQELEQIGRGLYGRSWKAQLADELKIDRRTVTSWQKNGCPKWLTAEELAPIAANRYHEVSHAVILTGAVK